MPYAVTLAASAVKALKRIAKPDRDRIRTALSALADNPRPTGTVKLRGEEDLYRVRVGQYRIVYTVDDGAVTVLVVKIGHRRDVYRK
jgi:mRNA interferase RelE/StbE